MNKDANESLKMVLKENVLHDDIETFKKICMNIVSDNNDMQYVLNKALNGDEEAKSTIINMVRQKLDTKPLHYSLDSLFEIIKLEKKAQEADEKRRFDNNCERYRQMMKSNENEPFERRRDAINKFRAGY